MIANDHARAQSAQHLRRRDVFDSHRKPALAAAIWRKDIPMRTASSSRNGFTLIELLVVIAIIAILAAIFFPVFAKAREKARQITCVSNLKQLALGILQYNQDYDESMPATNTIWGGGWTGEIYSYIKSKGVYACPDDSTDPNNGKAGSYTRVSYGLNVNVLPAYGVGAGNYFTRSSSTALAAQNAPASTVLLFEIQKQLYVDVTNPREQQSAIGDGAKGYGGCNNSGIDSSNCSAVYATGLIDGYAIPNWQGALGVHTDGANYAALDGHVKWLRPSQVSGGLTAPTENSPASRTKVTAAGTGSMIMCDGVSKAALTFSQQ